MSMLLHMVAGTLNVGGDTLEVQSATVYDQAMTVNSVTTASAAVVFNSDSTVDYERLNTGNTTNAYNWIVPADNAANYEVRATVVSGPTSGGSSYGSTLGSWISLAGDVQYGVSVTAIDDVTQLVLNIEISADSGSTIAASNQITLRAEVVNLGGA